MEEMGIEQINFDQNQSKNAENLELKNYDSLDEPEVVNGQFSNTFDIGSDKLDSNTKNYNSNKSLIYDSKIADKTKDDSRSLDYKNHNHHNFKHHHGHGGSAENLNVRAAAIHILGDIIQSAGVLLAALLIYAFPNLNIIDPLCTFLFSILVVFTTYYIVKDCMIILLEGVPTSINYDSVKIALETINGVASVKELHIWSLTSGKH